VTHPRRPLAWALALNTAVVVAEFSLGFFSHSVSLVSDAVHNLSDEGALIALFLAFLTLRKASSRLLAVSNVLNTVGLLTLSTVVFWAALKNLRNPPATLAWGTILGGILAAAGNFQIARLLRGPGKTDAAVRLAYLHNLGDAVVSLAPIVAGLAIVLTGWTMWDAAIAMVISAWFMATTVWTAVRLKGDLIWPQATTCAIESAPNP
jgi:cation diffusion facilitator family transporter